MRYINPDSDYGIVNHLADFIMNELSENNKYDSIIKVTKFKPFYVVEGITSSNNVLDLTKTINKFISKIESSDSIVINTIDLINYGIKEYGNQDDYSFTFFNSDRKIFNENLIKFSIENDTYFEFIDYQNDKVTIFNSITLPSQNLGESSNFRTMFGSMCSEFPYGYSLNNHRLLFYYFEYIVNQLIDKLMVDSITIKYHKKQNDESYDTLSTEFSGPYPNEKISSMILDVFDFNLTKFYNDYFKNYDITNEINTQLGSKPWLKKDKVSELFII